MKHVNIYLEGTNDRSFLMVYLQEVLGARIENLNPKNTRARDRIYEFYYQETVGEIKLLAGWQNLASEVFREEFQANREDGITTLVLVDADVPPEGGYVKRKNFVQPLSKQCTFNYFIVPNDEDNGTLETLLQSILQPAATATLNCIQQQEECLKQVQKEFSDMVDIVLTPDKDALKQQIGYMRTLLQSKGFAGFQNPNIWNLQHPYLDPLKTFLQTHL